MPSKPVDRKLWSAEDLQRVAMQRRREDLARLALPRRSPPMVTRAATALSTSDSCCEITLEAIDRAFRAYPIENITYSVFLAWTDGTVPNPGELFTIGVYVFNHGSIDVKPFILHVETTDSDVAVLQAPFDRTAYRDADNQNRINRGDEATSMFVSLGGVAKSHGDFPGFSSVIIGGHAREGGSFDVSVTGFGLYRIDGLGVPDSMADYVNMGNFRSRFEVID